MIESKTWDIDTFHFNLDKGGRLYVWGLDDFALHYDLTCNYDVIAALIDFNRPHHFMELDYGFARNNIHREKIENYTLNDRLSYPTWFMSEEGIGKLYKNINGVELPHNFSHKNYRDRCSYVESLPSKTVEILGRNHSLPKTNNRMLDNPNYAAWRQSVLKRDGFKCVVCGDDEHLEAHHMYGYTENPELAVEVTNGVTLCRWCHKKYHSKYGIKNINPVDFMNFIKRFGVR